MATLRTEESGCVFKICLWRHEQDILIILAVNIVAFLSLSAEMSSGGAEIHRKVL